MWQLTKANGRSHVKKAGRKVRSLLLTRQCVTGLQIELYLSKAANDMKNTDTLSKKLESSIGKPQVMEL